jgi:hypothetical protein
MPGAGGTGAGGAGGPMMTGGPGAGNTPATSSTVSRDGWRPLSSFMATGGGNNPSGIGFNPSQEPVKPKAPSGAAHTRTEFVVVFFWQEPAPSDKLREPPPPPKPAATPTTPTTPTTPSTTPSTQPSGGDERPLTAGGGLKVDP